MIIVRHPLSRRPCFPQATNLSVPALVVFSGHSTQAVVPGPETRSPDISKRRVSSVSAPSLARRGRRIRRFERLLIVFIASSFFEDALAIMHSACQIGNVRIGYGSRHGVQVRSCRGKAMYNASAFLEEAIRARRSNGKHEARSIISYSPLPAFFDFNTFNARVINGSMPFLISVFLLSSLKSTGTPLPS